MNTINTFLSSMTFWSICVERQAVARVIVNYYILQCKQAGT